MIVTSEGCDGGESGGSRETKKAVPVSEFGLYFTEHHAQGNKMFTRVYQVKWVLLYKYTSHSVSLYTNYIGITMIVELWTCY